jgi:hypothetical protein
MLGHLCAISVGLKAGESKGPWQPMPVSTNETERLLLSFIWHIASRISMGIKPRMGAQFESGLTPTSKFRRKATLDAT